MLGSLVGILRQLKCTSRMYQETFSRKACRPAWNTRSHETYMTKLWKLLRQKLLSNQSLSCSVLQSLRQAENVELLLQERKTSYEQYKEATNYSRTRRGPIQTRCAQHSAKVPYCYQSLAVMSASDLMSSTNPGNRSKTQSAHATTHKLLHVMKLKNNHTRTNQQT